MCAGASLSHYKDTHYIHASHIPIATIGLVTSLSMGSGVDTLIREVGQVFLDHPLRYGRAF